MPYGARAMTMLSCRTAECVMNSTTVLFGVSSPTCLSGHVNMHGLNFLGINHVDLKHWRLYSRGQSGDSQKVKLVSHAHAKCATA